MVMWRIVAVPYGMAVPGSRQKAAGFPFHCHLLSRLSLTVGSTGVLGLPATLGDKRELGEVTAAFRSRSRALPHASQEKMRSSRVSLAFTHPHVEHILDEG
jgi:hypothetical protein